MSPNHHPPEHSTREGFTVLHLWAAALCIALWGLREIQPMVGRGVLLVLQVVVILGLGIPGLRLWINELRCRNWPWWLITPVVPAVIGVALMNTGIALPLVLKYAVLGLALYSAGLYIALL